MRYLAITIAVLLAVFSCNSRQETPSDPDVYYTCSMDPQVIAYKPGKCPVCKMELTRVERKSGAEKEELKLSEQQIQLGNITTDTLRNSAMGNQLTLTATLNFDHEKTGAVGSRVAGRVEKLYYKNTGDYVMAGTPLFEVYSEELNNAKQEYLLALDRKKSFEGETTIDFGQLVRGAKNKLLLLGMTETQVSELEKAGKASPGTAFYSPVSGYITERDIREGDYVTEGGTVVKLADLSTLWAEAQVYTSQLSGIDRGSLATVRVPALGGKEIRGSISFVNPEISPDTRIDLLRVAIPNPGNRLKPGMPAYLVLSGPERKTLTLPTDAVIRDADGATVWVRTGPHSFRNRMVTTGLENGDRIEVLSGLAKGDVVVLSGAYLLQSEYVFKKGATPMEGMDMGGHAH